MYAGLKKMIQQKVLMLSPWTLLSSISVLGWVARLCDWSCPAQLSWRRVVTHDGMWLGSISWTKIPPH